MKEPIPIQHSDLPDDRGDAIECWQYNVARACGYTRPSSPVTRVWATRRARYWRKPDPTEYGSGTSDVGVLYRTEADAWQACIAEVREWCDKRIAILEKMSREPSP